MPAFDNKSCKRIAEAVRLVEQQWPDETSGRGRTKTPLRFVVARISSVYSGYTYNAVEQYWTGSGWSDKQDGREWTGGGTPGALTDLGGNTYLLSGDLVLAFPVGISYGRVDWFCLSSSTQPPYEGDESAGGRATPFRGMLGIAQLATRTSSTHYTGTVRDLGDFVHADQHIYLPQAHAGLDLSPSFTTAVMYGTYNGTTGWWVMGMVPTVKVSAITSLRVDTASRKLQYRTTPMYVVAADPEDSAWTDWHTGKQFSCPA